jgi:hypothetical protein
VGSRMCPSADTTSWFAVMVVTFLRRTQDLDDRTDARAVPCAEECRPTGRYRQRRERVAEGCDQKEKRT